MIIHLDGSMQRQEAIATTVHHRTAQRFQGLIASLKQGILTGFIHFVAENDHCWDISCLSCRQPGVSSICNAGGGALCHGWYLEDHVAVGRRHAQGARQFRPVFFVIDMGFSFKEFRDILYARGEDQYEEDDYAQHNVASILRSPLITSLQLIGSTLNCADRLPEPLPDDAHNICASCMVCTLTRTFIRHVYCNAVACVAGGTSRVLEAELRLHRSV